MEEENERIGGVVRRLREAANLTQAELADALTERGIRGIYPQTITKIEAGNRVIKLTEGLAIADVLKVDPHALAVDDENANIRLAVARLRAKTYELRALRMALGEAAARAQEASKELFETVRDADALVEARWPPQQFGPGRPSNNALPSVVKDEYVPAVEAALAEMDALDVDTTGKPRSWPLKVRSGFSRRLAEWHDG